MRCWLLTNGFGEDYAGALIACELRARCPELGLLAAPLLTPGAAFERCGVAVVAPGTAPPSGGFPTASARTMLGDLPTVPAYFRYVGKLRRLREPEDFFVAVGDVFMVALARLAFGRSGVLVALPKSVYGRRYSAVEYRVLRWCSSTVFARDQATCEALKAAGVRAEFAGNPLVDRPVAPAADVRVGAWVGERQPLVLLLPGSRSEAPLNFIKLLEVAGEARQLATWICAWPESVAVSEAAAAAENAGWRVSDEKCTRGRSKVSIVTGAFHRTLDSADVVVGLAGTANEQAAALGKPIVTFVGAGPQTTAARMREQQELLGGAAQFVEGTAARVAAAVDALLASPEERSRRGALGIARLGPPGGAGRIADRLLCDIGRQLAGAASDDSTPLK